MNGSERDFKRGAVAAAVDAMKTASGERAAPAGGLTRRRLLKAGAAGAAFGGLPWLASCGGGDDPAPQPGPRVTETRTIFFNHSHLNHAGKQMMFQVGRTRHRLRPIAEVPDVLVRERANNRFLSAVPDTQITHAVEGVEVDAEYVTVGCAFTATANGQWTMDGVHILLPQAASPIAYERLKAVPGPQKTSLKRQKYGMAPVASAQELHEEQALLDTASHSATLLTAHKDMMGADPGAASTVINVHVMNSDTVLDLDDALSQLGTAAPETTAGSTNDTGWATLRPVVNKVTNQPFTMGTDGRICYMSVLHPTVARLCGQGVAEVLPQVQNDTSLGVDISAPPDAETLRGKLWTRQDGAPSTVQKAPTPGALTGAAPSMATNWPNGSNHWLACDATATPLGGGIQQLDINYTNTGLRYLSCYIEFVKEDGSLLTMDQMPGWADGTWVTAPRTSRRCTARARTAARPGCRSVASTASAPCWAFRCTRARRSSARSA